MKRAASEHLTFLNVNCRLMQFLSMVALSTDLHTSETLPACKCSLSMQENNLRSAQQTSDSDTQSFNPLAYTAACEAV
jgi:hypothetical protein